VTRVPIGQQRRGRLTEVLRKWVDLELRHGRVTIPSH
jgi:hypothetical protein